MMCSNYFILLLLVLLSAPLLTEAQNCELGGTFFPKGYENANYPAPFTLEAQTTAGYLSGDPLRVVISGANPKEPTLYFSPSWFLLTTGRVDASCNTAVETLLATSPKRKLSQTASTSKYEVIKAATYEFSWNLNGGDNTYVGKYSAGSKPPSVTFSLNEMPDDDYCFYATALIMAESATVSTGTTSVLLPTSNTKVTKLFCFQKLTQRITGDLSFDSCKKNFTITPTKLSMTPMYATTGMPLYSIMIHVHGNTSREADPEGRSNYFDAYIEWSDPSKPFQARWTSDNMKEGLYSIRAESSIRVKPAVLSLVNATGQQAVPDSLFDDSSYFFLGWDLTLDRVGKKPWTFSVYNTPTAISEPECDVSTDLSVIEINWDYTGAGNMTCLVDRKKANNVPDPDTGSLTTCGPPYKYKLGDNTTRTLEIFFNDACGHSRRKEVQFGRWGCKTNVTAEPPAPPGPPPAPPSPVEEVSAPSTPFNGGTGLAGLNSSSGSLLLSGASSSKSGAARSAHATPLSVTLGILLTMLLTYHVS